MSAENLRTGRPGPTYAAGMTLASMLVLRNVDPKPFRLYNRALAAQGAPTLNRANRRATASVIAKRDRQRAGSRSLVGRASTFPADGFPSTATARP